MMAAASIDRTSRDLRVSDNQRFLVRGDGTPFFWLGDTAWELFHRLNREEAVHYLRDRARKGFTVIQAVALAELDGLNTPNAYGHRPLRRSGGAWDPAQPDVKGGAGDDYWTHVDYVIDAAQEQGLYMGLLPTWGDQWWGLRDGSPGVFTVENAAAYGEFLGRRYRDRSIIWILGGDRTPETEDQRDIIRAMARGLRAGDGGRGLRTFHPRGGQGSATWFHEEEWLDCNMRQNGHATDFPGHYENTGRDYARTPAKPVVDGEPLYEDHPIYFKADSHGLSTAADVRRALYWDLFQGACGHTYGHHSVWQMWSPERQPVNQPLLPWRDALDQPGAGQMQWARWLLESRPFLSRIPDDTVIVPHRVSTAVPGAGTRRFVATRDEEGSYIMVYVPVGRPFGVRMDAVRGSAVRAWWYDPRTGAATCIGHFPSTGECTFISPTPGETTDWVLVLDSAERNYPPPGSRDAGA